MSIYDESPLINYLLFAFVRAQSLPGTLTGRFLLLQYARIIIADHKSGG